MSNVKVKIQVLSTENSNTNVITDSISVNQEIQETAITEVTRSICKTIPAATALQEILPVNTTQGMSLLFSDQEIQISINNSTDLITLSPVSAGVKTPVFLIRGSITSIRVTTTVETKLDITTIKV